MKLENNLLLFFTGFTHSANEILEEQNIKSINLDKNMISNLDLIKEMGYQTKDCLEKGKIEEFGKIMNTHWKIKKQRSSKITNPQIDEWYEYALKNGAIGGKIIGSGGGGFLMFLSENPNQLRNAMKKTGMEEIRFKFDFEGTRAL